MIDADLGFDGTEFIDRAVAFVGNTSDSFREFAAKSLPFAIQRYARFHDWSFLFKYNLALSVVEGTSEYDLNVANLGFKMDTDSVQTIYNPTNNCVIRKLDLTGYRANSYYFNDEAGAEPVTAPSVWAEIGANRIILGPQLFETQELKIDGTIIPSNFSTAAAAYDIDTAPDAFDGVFPEIPFEYQEAFFEYFLALTLDRENDDRASAKKSLAADLVNKDIQHDLRRAGDQTGIRFKTIEELFYDGNY